jgi:hypothetical protein
MAAVKTAMANSRGRHDKYIPGIAKSPADDQAGWASGTAQAGQWARREAHRRANKERSSVAGNAAKQQDQEYAMHSDTSSADVLSFFESAVTP